MTIQNTASASRAQTEAATRAPSCGSGPIHTIGRSDSGRYWFGPPSATARLRSSSSSAMVTTVA